MPIRTYFEDGFDNVLIENEFILAVFLPSLGSKMIRLVNKGTGTQFLLESQGKDKKYPAPGYGEEFSEKYAYGFDDCFPTIASTLKEIRMPGGGYPDHGELWSLPWRYLISDEKIIFRITGIIAHYAIDKIVSLDRNKLIINYSLQNLSKERMDYIWSAHPLLKVKSGDRIILSREVKNVLLDYSQHKKPNTSDEILTWPFIDNDKKEIDYSKVPDVKFGKAVKFFTGKLKTGFAGLHRLDSDETILFTFNPAELNYLGVWLCYGGWPADSSIKHLAVALEPTNGRPDSLVEAIIRNEAGSIGVSETKNWSLEISLWKGLPDILPAELKNSDQY